MICIAVEVELENGPGGAVGVDWLPAAPFSILSRVNLTADQNQITSVVPIHFYRFLTLVQGQGFPVSFSPPVFDTSANAINKAMGIVCVFGSTLFRPYAADEGLFLPGAVFDEVRLDVIWSDASQLVTDPSLVTLNAATAQVIHAFGDPRFRQREYRGTPMYRFAPNPIGTGGGVLSYQTPFPVRWLGFTGLDAAGDPIDEAFTTVQGTYQGGTVLFQVPAGVLNLGVLNWTRFNLAIAPSNPADLFPAYYVYMPGSTVDLSGGNFRLLVDRDSSAPPNLASLAFQSCEVGVFG